VTLAHPRRRQDRGCWNRRQDHGRGNREAATARQIDNGGPTVSTPTTNEQYRSSSGWAVFVTAYLAIAGVLNIIWGIAALSNKQYFISGGLVWSELNTWGWVAIILGTIQALGALLVLERRAGGAIIAGTLAFFGIILNFLSIGAYPVWSSILLVADALIIWAVTVHSDAFLEE
jgi:hypothetical protein